MTRLKRLARSFSHTPLHPQWLLGRRKPSSAIRTASGRVLDVGAADRWIRPWLSENVEYVALDYPVTGQNLYGATPDVFADAAHLPFPDDCFDGVVCLEVLEHVPHPSKVMAEISRVLKSGGRAWISMPFLYPLHDAPFDFQRFTEYGLQRELRQAGLNLVRLQKSGHAIRAAGFLLCLAVAGGAHSQRKMLAYALLPVTLIAVLTINITAWLVSLVWPDWHHMAMGYELEARKP